MQRYPDEDKAVDILQKTWGKMSARGHAAALALPLGDAAKALVGRAFSSNMTGSCVPRLPDSVSMAGGFAGS
jgi:hypothetical protein